MTVIHKIAHRIEIMWYNNHPLTPPSFLHCMQTIRESEQSMIPIRLEAIRRLLPVHTVVTEHSYRLKRAWDPESVLILSALNMDKTNTLYLPYDLTKLPAATTELAKSIIEDTITNPEKLLDTYPFAPDFDALVASDPIRHEAIYSYSANAPCTYSEVLHKQSRQAEILWYDNHPEVPPSFSHCFLTIGEFELLHDRVLRESTLTNREIYVIRTEHAYAMRESWPTQPDSDNSSRNSDTTVAPYTTSAKQHAREQQSLECTSSTFSSIDSEDNKGFTDEQAAFRRLLIRNHRVPNALENQY